VGDAVDAAEIGSAAEDKARVLLQDDLPLSGNPVGVISSSLARATLCESDRSVTNGCHLGRVFRLIASELFQKSKPLTLP